VDDESYRRSMELAGSMSDEDVRSYVQEREIDAYGQELVGEIQLAVTEEGPKLATWESRVKSA
jgi:hypothetical protein